MRACCILVFVCLRPAMVRLLQRIGFCPLAVVLVAAASSVPLDAKAAHSTPRDSAPASAREHWGRLVVRSSSYHEMLRGNSSQGCAAKTPPEALATPNPLLDAPDNLRLTVSFVVGTDGRVYSPLVLEGANEYQARPVLDAVRHWRFRPAVCNGAPAEFEAKVEFSSLLNRF